MLFSIFLLSLLYIVVCIWASQVALVIKNPPVNAGNARDTVSTPRLGRSPGVGNGNLLQYFWLGNPMDTGVW